MQLTLDQQLTDADLHAPFTKFFNEPQGPFLRALSKALNAPSLAFSRHYLDLLLEYFESITAMYVADTCIDSSLLSEELEEGTPNDNDNNNDIIMTDSEIPNTREEARLRSDKDQKVRNTDNKSPTFDVSTKLQNLAGSVYIAHGPFTVKRCEQCTEMGAGAILLHCSVVNVAGEDETVATWRLKPKEWRAREDARLKAWLGTLSAHWRM